jgi:hypothetical protein
MGQGHTGAASGKIGDLNWSWFEPQNVEIGARQRIVLAGAIAQLLAVVLILRDHALDIAGALLFQADAINLLC